MKITKHFLMTPKCLQNFATVLTIYVLAKGVKRYRWETAYVSRLMKTCRKHHELPHHSRLGHYRTTSSPSAAMNHQKISFPRSFISSSSNRQDIVAWLDWSPPSKSSTYLHTNKDFVDASTLFHFYMREKDVRAQG